MWLQSPDIAGANGLVVDGDHLVVCCSGDGCLKSVNLADKSVSTIASVQRGEVVDGVRLDGSGNYIVTINTGRTFLVSRNGEREELINTTAPSTFAANIEYIPDQGLLIIPTWIDNRLMAYKLNPATGG
jgi:hypothetical protein